MVGSLLPLVFALTSTTAGGPIEWQSSFPDALERAAHSKRVVFIAVNMDGERANDEHATVIYRDPDIVALASFTVNLIASQDRHAAGDGGCSRFPGIPCEAHQLVDRHVREKVVKATTEGWVIAPQHVFLAPDGKVLLSVPYAMTKGELQWCFHTALSKVDPAFGVPMPPKAMAPQRLILGDVHDPAQGDEVVQILPKSEVLRLLAQYPSLEKPRDRWEVLRRVLLADEPEVVDFLRKEFLNLWLTRNLEPRVRTLRFLGSHSPARYVEILEEHVDDLRANVRSEVAVALEQQAQARSLKVIRRALDDEQDPEARKNWIRALGACGSEDAGTRKHLTKLAQHEKIESARLNAIVALGYLQSHKDVVKVLGKAVTSKDASERAAAACAMALSRDREYLPGLEEALASEKEDRAREAIAAAIQVLQGEADLRAVGPIVERICHDRVPRPRVFGTP